jgi:hypothetical protein
MPVAVRDAKDIKVRFDSSWQHYALLAKRVVGIGLAILACARCDLLRLASCVAASSVRLSIHVIVSLYRLRLQTCVSDLSGRIVPVFFISCVTGTNLNLVTTDQQLQSARIASLLRQPAGACSPVVCGGVLFCAVA